MIKVINQIISNKLGQIHTAYIAKVLKVSSNHKTAKIQPLQIVDIEDEYEEQSVITEVPIIESARFHQPVSGDVDYIKKNDIVLVISCETDITEAKNGKNAIGSGRKFDMSDSVIVGII